MIVWALFDSGNGSYLKASRNFEEIEIYPIGMDIQKKNDHFINLDLANYGYLFGDNKLFDTLNNLPKPNLIIASPPCESWSVASAMNEGNACWKQQTGDSLFHSQTPLSRFTIRDFKDYENYQFKPDKSLITRINGELCIINTIKIIQKYKPEIFIIENPAHGRIWEYIKKILGFHIQFENLTYYNNYGYPIKKPTKFGSNINLNLKQDLIPNEVEWNKTGWSYNERSNIPEKLVQDIFYKSLSYLKEMEK